MSLRSRPDLKQRRRAATLSVGDAGGVDFISGLSNDLLVRILELLPDARDVVRTHALSRRWRGLWTGVAALRFDFFTSPNKLPGADDVAAERYLAFVNDALALRATANASSVIEDLAISFDISSEETGQLVPLSVEAAQGWIRYAAQQEVKYFVLKLKLPWRRVMDTQGGDGNDIEHHPVMTLNETDSYAKMETMHLSLGAMELRLPSSAVLLASLADLSLNNIKHSAGGGYLLSRLVSSACCPLLRKLRLARFKMPRKEELLIEAGTLLELSIEEVYGAQFLELRTPSLRVLNIVDCLRLDEFTFTAPASRLEDLMVWARRPLRIDDVHGHLSSVKTLKIQLFSHGMTEHHTRSVDRIKGRIPPLPHVTSLSVCLALREQHTSGSGIACLLAHCSNIQYLSLQLRSADFTEEENHSELDLSCDYSCHWKSHKLSLAHLQEVEFKNLIGTNCEFQFIQSILTGAPGIQKVNISFDRRYWPHAFKVMPPLEGGSWTACNDDTSLWYKWRSENLVSEVD